MPCFPPLSRTVNFALQSLRPSPTFPTAIFFAAIVVGQVAENPDKETVRAAVSLNADGSRTTYRFDWPQQKNTALTPARTTKCAKKSDTTSTIANGSFAA